MCEIDWVTFLEYLKLLLSWPPVIAGLVVWFSRRFSTAIASKLGNLKHVAVGSNSATFEVAQQAAAPVQVELPGEAASVDAEAAPVAAATAGNGPVINWAITPEALELAADGDVQAAVQYAHHNPGPIVSEYLVLAARFHFERTFNLIFGSQISALEFLSNVGQPQDAAALMPYYEIHKERTEGKGEYAAFIRFVFGQNLMQDVGGPGVPLYSITPIGKRFLEYIRSAYAQSWNTKAF